MSPCYLLLLIIPLVTSQTFHWGACPTPMVQSNFSMQQFLGMWYEIERLPSFHETGKCVEADFFMKSGSTCVMVSEMVNHNVEAMEGMVYLGEEEPAMMEISYQLAKNIFFDLMFPRCPWWVLSTDYSDVAVIYSCLDFFDIFHVDHAWILARNRTLPSQVLDDARQVFTQGDINIGNMMMSDQTGCY